MKPMMYTMLAALFLNVQIAFADKDFPVKPEELPIKAKEFITTYFPKTAISFSKKEVEVVVTGYEVIFTDGNKIEFERDGAWKEVNCRYSEVPTNLVPVKIATYLKEYMPNHKVLKMEKKKKGLKLKLKGGIDLLFSTEGTLLKMND